MIETIEWVSVEERLPIASFRDDEHNCWHSRLLLVSDGDAADDEEAVTMGMLLIYDDGSELWADIGGGEIAKPVAWAEMPKGPRP